MDALLADLRYVIRQLRSRPRFTAAVLVTIALGIGANVAVFSLANWVVLRPVPGVSGQERLVEIESRRDDGLHNLQPVSYPNLRDLATGTPGLDGLAGATDPIPSAIYWDGGEPRYLKVTYTSSNYFGVLGTRFADGRAYTGEDELAASGAPVVVISDQLRRQAFGEGGVAVGRTLTVNGTRAMIVGVAPAGFRGTERLGDADIWMPGTAIVRPGSGSHPAPDDRRSAVFTHLIGRLAPGTSVEQLRGRIGAVAANLVKSYPEANAGWTPPTVFEGIGVPTREREAVQRTMILLAGIAGIVLLVTCANVANLFLFRGMGRRTEWAVRRALGASVGRLIRLQLAESLVLSFLASIPAVLLALWLTGLFRGKVMPGLGEIDTIGIDWRVLVFTGLIALMTGVLSGIIPAISALRADAAVGIRAGATGISRGGVSLRGLLASGQLALALSLLVTAFLLVGTVRNLRAVDVGFDADSVTSFTINPMLSGYSRDASLGVIKESLRRIQVIPGVDEAALSPVAPFMSTIIGRAKTGEAAPGDTGIAATSAWVSAEYFRALGIPLLEGRTFDESEEFFSLGKPRQPVAIVSRTLARRLFGDGDPLGRTVATAFPGPPARVIGVVDDSRWGSLVDEGLGPMQYYPIPDAVVVSGATFIVRSSLAPSTLRAAVQRAVSEAAPSVPLFDAMRLRQRVDQTMSEQRLLARLLGSFSLLAVVLATVGLYSVIASSVAERTKELGIRMALGARSEQILAMIVRRGALLGVCGVAFGIAGALVLSRLVSSQLFGVSSAEPIIYSLSAVLLFALVLIASLIPARQATRLDPVSALRTE
jgi:predicted permease